MPAANTPHSGECGQAEERVIRGASRQPPAVCFILAMARKTMRRRAQTTPPKGTPKARTPEPAVTYLPDYTVSSTRGDHERLAVMHASKTKAVSP
jgi:hypothetical protein